MAKTHPVGNVNEPTVPAPANGEPLGAVLPQGAALPQGRALPHGIPVGASPGVAPASVPPEDEIEVDWGDNHPRASHAAAQQPLAEMAPAPLVVTGALAPFKARRSSTRSAVINLVGHVVFSGLGLLAGYYALCWLRPEANFLQLKLPGLPQPPTAAAPAEPGQP